MMRGPMFYCWGTFALQAALLLVVIVPSTGQQMRIPARPLGFAQGSPDALIRIDEFFDLQCPDCKHSYPVTKQVIQYYGNKIYYVVHIYPLWLHHQAWTLAKASELVKSHAPQHYLQFVEYVFDKQESFYNAEYFDKSEKDLYDALSKIVDTYGISNDTFYKQMDGFFVYAAADNAVHYGISQQVMGTPTFFVNGVKDNSLGTDSTFDQWKTLIDGLLSTSQ